MTTTLTIDELDADTLERLALEATRRGVSMAALARTLLRESVDASCAVHHDLDGLMGTWSEEDANSFDRATGGMRHIDAELW